MALNINIVGLFLLSDIHTLKQLLHFEIIHYIAAVPLCAPLNLAHILICKECISFKGGQGGPLWVNSFVLSVLV